jgi:two-component system, OmpR family, phosphate regulon sensor histidine kinase PhoR
VNGDVATTLRAQRGRFVHRLSGRTAGPAALAKRRVLAALLVLCVLLSALLATGVLATVRLYHSAENRYIGVVFPLTTLTRDVVLQMEQEETGTRGYMLTTSRRSLAPYFAGRKGVLADLRQIRALTRGQPVLSARMRVITQEVIALHGYYDRLIVFVADGLLGQQRARQEVFDGEQLAARFRDSTSLMQNDIGRLLQTTRDQQHMTFDRSLGALGIGGFLALAIAGTLLINVPERLRLLYAAEEKARVQAEQGANAARALAHVSDAVLLVDEAGSIRYWNAAAERLFGRTTSEAVGRRANVVVPDYERMLEAGQSDDSFVPVTIDDVERWLAPTLSSFEGGSVLTVRDATAGYLLERARSDFVATASHELRTPLTSIYGGIRTLNARGDELDPAQRERLLHLIEQESAQLAHIVDQLLISTRLDRRELHLNETDCELSSLCEEVVDAARLRAPEAIKLTLDARRPLRPLRVDESLLRQVLVNLIDNAIKYSADGRETTVRLSEESGQIRIDVVDQGPGIASAEHKRIFDKFYRLDAAMSSGVGGSGLGLYISRAIVTEMGGTLTVHSTLGAGSTFTVTLPYHDGLGRQNAA